MRDLRGSSAHRISRRRLIGAAGLGAVTGVGLLAACGKSGGRQPAARSSAGAASTPKQGGTLNTVLTVNPPSLDSQQSLGAAGRSVMGHVSSRLFRHKSDADPLTAWSAQLENDLATHAESPDGITWTITLRPDAKFQNITPVNGHAVEAEDVKATFVRALTLPQSSARPYMSAFDANQIDTPDRNTIVFKLKFASGILPQNVTAGSWGWIFPREALAGSYDPAKQPIGCGPFILDSYTPDVAVVYKRNPDWFGKPAPYIDGERAAIIPDAAQRLAQFAAGNLDELNITQTDLDALKRSRPAATVISAPANFLYFQLFAHIDHPGSPYRDVRVRQALSMAIDRTAIGNAAFGGVYQNNGVLYSAFGKWALPPDQLGSGSQYYAYNPQAARQLLAASGAADQLKKFVYPNNVYGPAWDTIAQALNPMLNAVGFKTELVPIDYSSQFINVGKGVLYGHFDDDTLACANWVSGPPAEQVLFDALTPGGGSNHAFVNDTDLTAVLTKMIATLDEQERLKQLQDIQRSVADRVYHVTGIPTGNLYTALQPRVRGYAYSLDIAPAGSETYAKVWLAG